MTPCSLGDSYFHFQIQVLKFLKLESKNVRKQQIIMMNSVYEEISLAPLYSKNYRR